MEKIVKKNKEKSKIKKEIKILICGFSLILILGISVITRRSYVLSEKNLISTPLTTEEHSLLSEKIKSSNYERLKPIHSLPYDFPMPNLSINAKAAILVSCDTGDIIFEKNADTEIPPASMTKVFLMYTVFEKISEGKVSLDDVVPLPPDCWASHMPPHSSLMFLGKDQLVTLRELLTGLAVCSGNDASHAIAYYLFGNTENFIKEVNRQIKLCGLEKTIITEPSGYSEKNITTAREMATFAKIYIQKYPESLELFHSVKSFSYPQKHNIAPTDKNKAPQNFNGVIPNSIWTTIVQNNTNTLLKSLDGCDGLKTGYIDESGYNLSLTCKRKGERYLSVTMGGPGKNIVDGDKMRMQDGITLQEYAFNSFYKIENIPEQKLSVTVPLLGSKKNAVTLIVPYDVNTVIPKKIFKDNNVQVNVVTSPVLFGQIVGGKQYGKLRLSLDGLIIEEVPLIAPYDINESGIVQQFIDRIVYQTIK